MADARRNKLIVPTVLVVSVLGGFAACSKDLECYDRLSEQECKDPGIYACQWDAKSRSCSPDCPAHTDRSGCEGDPACEWLGTSCDLSFA
jgi:hypothetical protein